MKKLLFAFVPVLCVLCVLAFASCGKKTDTANTTEAQKTTPTATTASNTAADATAAATTTAEATTAPAPAHEHTAESEYTIDVPATCKAAGSKSYHCEECGNIIEGTSVEIPADPDAHVVDDWNVTKKASVLGDGTREGVCTLCSAPVVQTIEFKAEVWSSDERDNDFKIKRHLLDALDEGEHFYPTETNPGGKDYYFEVELLWNETITTNWVEKNGFRIELVNADSTRDNLFLLVPKSDNWSSSDAKASGGFDYGWAAKHTIVYGPKGVDGTGTNAENFPNIGGYGWHRIGVKVHQEAEISGDGVTFSMVTTLYVDGAKVWQINFVEDGEDNFSKWVTKGIMLFTATNENGTIVYGDPDYELCLDMSAWKSAEAMGVYVIHGLVTSAAVDPDFAPEYVPVADPVDATFSPEEGVEMPAKVFFAEQ